MGKRKSTKRVVVDNGNEIIWKDLKNAANIILLEYDALHSKIQVREFAKFGEELWD